MSIGLQQQCRLRLQPPACVIECSAAHIECADLAADGAAGVVQLLCARVDHDVAADDSASAVGQTGVLQTQCIGGLDGAIVVADRGVGDHREIGACNDGACCVVECPGRKLQLSRAGHYALRAIVEHAVHVQLQHATGRMQGAGLVVDAGGGDAPVTAKQDLALLVLQRLRNGQR